MYFKSKPVLELKLLYFCYYINSYAMDFQRIFNRSKNLIIDPNKEWEVIQNEFKTKDELIRGYLIPYILAIAIASVIGNLLFDPKLAFISVGYLVATALISVVISFVSVYLSVLVFNELAKYYSESFSKEKIYTLVIYSFTAFFLATIISNLFPVSGVKVLLNLFGLYSFYLLWTGAEKLIGITEDKKVAYVLIGAIIVVVLYLLLSLVFGLMVRKIFIITGLL